LCSPRASTLLLVSKQVVFNLQMIITQVLDRNGQNTTIINNTHTRNCITIMYNKITAAYN